MTRHPDRGVVLVLLSALTFGVSGAVAKSMLTTVGDELGPLQLTQLRITGAAALMLLVLWLTRRFGGPTVARRDRWTWTDLRMIVAYGLIAYLIIQLLYFVAIQRMPVGVTLLIEYLAPVMVIGWAMLVQRRPQVWTTWAGVVLALTGLVVLVQPWHGFALDGIGTIAALTAAVALACYFLLAESGTARIAPLELAAYGAAAASVALAVISPWWTFPFHVLTATGEFAGGRWPVWSMALVVIVVGTVMAYLLSIASLQHLPAPVVSVLATLEVVFAAVASWIFIGESLAAAEIVGGGILLVGAVLAQASRTPAPVAEDAVPVT